MYFTKILAIVITVIIIGVLFQSPVAKAQDSANYFNADFPAQQLPDDSIIIENNIANQSSIRTEIDIWENDLGGEVTDGSYVGAIFESSLMEVDYEPLRIDETLSYSVVYGETLPENEFPPHPIRPLTYNDQQQFSSNFPYLKKRSIITVAEVFNFTNRMIMSGATDFYVKLPLRPDCVDFAEVTPTICVFKVTNENTTEIQQSIDDGYLYLEPSFSVIYDGFPYRWESYDNGTVYDVEQKTGVIRTDINVGERLYPYYRGFRPNIIQPVREEDVVNDGIYARVLGTIEPNTNYIFTFNCILKSKPLVYLTEDDICSNGRNSKIIVSDLEFKLETDASWFSQPQEFTAHHGWHSLTKVYADTSTYPLVNETIDLPVDASFSFIFKAGRGSYGMFGHKFHFDQGDALVFYDRIDAPTTDKFLSIMLPFIADESLFVNITVTLLDPTNKFEPIGVISASGWDFVYVNTNVWHSDEEMPYTDYILFSVPYKVIADNIVTPNLDVKVMITFEEEADVTLMFSTPDEATSGFETTYIEQNPSLLDSVILPDALPLYIPYFKPRRKLTYIYEDVRTIQFAHYTWDDYEGFTEKESPNQNASHSIIKVPRDLSRATVMHYELFKSVQLTDGIWHELVTSGEGFQYATHFFERRISIGLLNFWVDTTDNDTEESVAWYDDGLNKWSNAWESLTKGDLLSAIYYAVSGTISLIWNGLQAFLGFIVGIFHKVWDGLVKVGTFIYSVLSSFVGQILSIIGDIINSLEDILNVLLYIITLLIFAYVVSWTGKLIFKRVDVGGVSF